MKLLLSGSIIVAVLCLFLVGCQRLADSQRRCINHTVYYRLSTTEAWHYDARYTEYCP